MKKFSGNTCGDCLKAVESLKDEIMSLPAMSISEFDPEKTELVIVDIVNGFVRQGAMASPLVEDIIPPVVSLMDKCAGKNIPIDAFADCHCAECEEFSSFPPHCIENTAESEIVDEIKAKGGKLLESIQLFDVYKGKQIADGFKSVAYSISFRADDRTLTDEEVASPMKKIIAELESKLGAQLRDK